MASLSYMTAPKLGALLSSPQRKDMYVRIENDRLVLGVDPLQPTWMVDFSKENLCAYNDAGAEPAPAHVDVTNDGRIQRRSGAHSLEVKGRIINCRSKKELLYEGLRALEGAVSGTIEKLSNVKGRSRRIVARDPKQLFDKPHLARDHAERLIGDWWYGTNNSEEQVRAWLKRACDIAGLKWGVDFKVHFGGKAEPPEIEIDL